MFTFESPSRHPQGGNTQPIKKQNGRHLCPPVRLYVFQISQLNTTVLTNLFTNN